MIIGITGKIGSGKSTIAKYLEDMHLYKEYSIAKPLKEIGKIFGFSYNQLYGTQEQKLEIHEDWGISSREFLQKVGTELFREILPKVIVNMKIKDSIWIDIFRINYRKNPDLYVISDIRFLDEAKMIKELGGVIIRTVRDNNVSSDDKNEHKHSSEIEMESIVADFVIDNNKLSKEEAKIEVDKIINNLIK